MSEFIMVVPPDWVEFSAANELINTGATPSDLVYYQIAQQAWGDIDSFLISAVLLPDGKNVTNARLIQTDNGYRLWMQFSS